MKVTTTIDVDMYMLACCLCSGMEGGINYWATITDYRKPKALDVTLDKLSAEKYPHATGRKHIYKHIDYVLNDGGGVEIQECERDERKYWLTKEALTLGVKLMAKDYPKHFADLVEDSGDAITGDVLIQLALFGEVIYG